MRTFKQKQFQHTGQSGTDPELLNLEEARVSLVPQALRALQQPFHFCDQLTAFLGALQAYSTPYQTKTLPKGGLWMRKSMHGARLRQ